MDSPEPFITLSDLFNAYRKAKADAFFDKTHFSSVAFAKYEAQLEKNLNKLLTRISSDDWHGDDKFIGSYSYLPKSLENPEPSERRSIEFATLDAIADWKNKFRQTKKLVPASFRLIMLPTVDFQVMSALWIMKVGYVYDDRVNRNLSFAHQIRRVGSRGSVADESHALFVPYMSGYRKWRSRGLEAMKDSVRAEKSIVAMTMDVEKFYHRVSPKFLSRPSFLKRLGIQLTSEQLVFNARFIKAIDCWYATTPDFKRRRLGALPVGLSASRVISNVLLAEFDKVMSSALPAIYYGRYADDVFLVVEAPDGVNTGEKFVRWIRKRLEGWVVLERRKDGSGLKLRLPYASDSDIVFASKKQKIFFLSGEHGVDLVDQIVEKIKQYSSEYRLLPVLPASQSEMASQALLASSDARLEADALRKAEATSIRRLNFAMLLGDAESYARDLRPEEWRELRKSFYGLVMRYVLTPSGFFDYFVYIVKAFGLMVSCGDLADAHAFVDQFSNLTRVLGATTTAKTLDKHGYELTIAHYRRGLLQAAYEAGSVDGFQFDSEYCRLLARLSKRSRSVRLSSAEEMVGRLMKADLGRRPYYDYWFKDNKLERVQPRLPRDFSIRRSLVLTKRFRNKVVGSLKAPYWPAIAFPTRPLPIWMLSVAAPDLLREPGGLERAIWSTRGSRVNPRYRDYSFSSVEEDGSNVVVVPTRELPSRMIGVPSFLTTDAQFNAAAKSRPDRSLQRYERVNSIINRILRESLDLHYVVFPECSLPLDWALAIAHKLGARGTSFIAGIENSGKGKIYRNDALVSLSSDFFGRTNAICFLQRKIALAHGEAELCASLRKKYVAPALTDSRPIYVHGDLCLAVLICSDLTNIEHRAHFQGRVDLLFVPQWNRDLGTFGFLVESAAHDLHAPIVQVNNRSYGDSRIRMPYAESHMRDVVRVKGGDADFYVVASVDFAMLRSFQRGRATEVFKPLPIGYRMSARRRDSGFF